MSETMMTVAEWHRLRDEDRMCWECGFHSPLVPVCGECEAHGKGIDAGRAAADGEIAAITAERDSLRSALAESARTIDAQEGRIHHLTALLATAFTERDEARSRLAKARVEIEAVTKARDEARSLDASRAVVQAACRCGSGAHPRRCIAHPLAYDHHVATLRMDQEEGQRIERDTASAIADWLERTTEPNDPCDGHCIAADIRANAWRSK